MFIGLTHEYMVKINIKKEHLAVESCSDNDGVIMWEDTSPLSGRMEIESYFIASKVLI